MEENKSQESFDKIKEFLRKEFPMLSLEEIQ
jgi:hypothetical protein